jgi:hypothetical protein
MTLDHAIRRDALPDYMSALAADRDHDIIRAATKLHAEAADQAGRDVTFLLRAAAYRHPEWLARLAEDIEERLHNLMQHLSTDGHDWCLCDYECICVGRGHGRCDRCESGPHDLLDDSMRELLVLLTEVTSERAVAECAGAA